MFTRFVPEYCRDVLREMCNAIHQQNAYAYYERMHLTVLEKIQALKNIEEDQQYKQRE